MSKIPQGEWSAIAARYSQGESISSIARHYGCTAPAIHYILKRNDQRVAEAIKWEAEKRQISASTEGDAAAGASERRLADIPAAPEIAHSSRLAGQRNRQSQGLIIQRAAWDQTSALALSHHRAEKSEPGIAARIKPAQTERHPMAAPQQLGGKRHSAAGVPALTAELDPELQAYAEAAIQAFRSSFDEALAQRSPVTRERLRQAASDLMRAAARTTIVLDRLNAGAKRTPIEVADWPRHSYAQEHARKATPA